MANYVSKYIGIFLWVLLACMVTGCQKEEGQVLNGDSGGKQKEIFQVEAVQWESGIQPESVDALCCRDGKVYFAGMQNNIEYIYQMNMDGTGQQKKELGNEFIGEIKKMAMDGKGNYRLLLEKFHFMGAREGYLEYSCAEFQEKKSKLKQTGEWKFDDADSVYGVDIDMEGIALFRASHDVEIYEKKMGEELPDKEGKGKQTVRGGKGEQRIMLDGESFWIFNDRVMQKWDRRKGEKLLEWELDTSDAPHGLIRPEKGGQEIYFISSDGIWESDGKSAELLVEWLENGIDGTEILDLCGDGKVFFAAAGNLQGLYKIEKKKSTGAEGKGENEEGDDGDGREMITVATTEPASQVAFVMDYVDLFNNSQDQYLARLKAYGRYEDPEGKIGLDIASGNSPDVLLLEQETGTLLDQLDKKGGLEDLYPYIDNDPDVSREDFVENALRLLETDGKLTRMAESFSIHAMIGTKEFIGDRTGWTWEEFAECMKAVPEGECAYMSYSGLFQDAFPSIYGQFFDFREGKARGNFVGCAELAEKASGDLGLDSESRFNAIMDERREKMRKGKFYTAPYYYPSMPFVLQPSFGVMEEKKELELIGYPCDAGTGVSMSFSRISVIPSVSGHKEGAWQFLKTILTAKGMYTVDGTYPVRKDYYEINKKCMLAKKKYVDEDGVQIYALGKENGYKITEEDIKKVERLIDMVDCRTLVSGHPLREIVEDEMAAYRAKDGTLEQAAGMIESRAKLYLGETS